MSAAEPKQRFFQFPLSLLELGATAKDKVNYIIGYSAISAGLHREKVIGKEQSVKIAKELSDKLSVTGFHPSNILHRAWALGKDIVGYCWHDSPKYCLDFYELCERHLAYCGPTPLVRVCQEIIQETDKGEFDFRLFTVLCAVYAPIGDKSYAIVRRDRVRAGALGYSRASLLFDREGKLTPDGVARLSKRTDGARPMTINQVRYALKRLHERKFFSRLQPFRNGRSVYYSRSMNHEELSATLLKRLEKRTDQGFLQGMAEDKFRKKAAFLLKRVKCGEKQTEGTKDSPQGHRTVTAPLTGGVTA